MKGLYFITSSDFKYSHEKLAEMALKAGIKIIQFREKKMSSKKMVEIAKKIRRLCNDYDATFIVNDRIDIALICDADGVHLGQDDIQIEDAKMIFDGIIGISVDNVEEALKAEKGGANYIGVGPVFPTSTKKDAGDVIGIDGLKNIKKVVSIPVVAIGGINRDNILQVSKYADCIAVVSAIANTEDPYSSARELLEILKKREKD